MDETPLVSVVLNTYNRAALLPEAAQSVLSQDYPNFEVVIVDDCSEDNTFEIVTQIVENNPDRVRSLRLPENRGLAAARNAGIRVARGSLIALQDDDDIWLPGKLTAQVEALRRHPECRLCYGKALQGTVEGDPTNQAYGGSERGRTGDNFELMLRHHPIKSPAVMLYRSALDHIGLFDESLVTAEDTELFLRVTMEYDAAYVDEPLVIVREHEDRKTRSESVSGTQARCVYRIFERLWETLPPSRESCRGLIAAGLARSTILQLECERSRETLDADTLKTVVEQNQAWSDHPEALRVVADRLVRQVENAPGAVVDMAQWLSRSAGTPAAGRRRTAAFLNAACRRGIRLGKFGPLLTWLARYAVIMPRRAWDRIAVKA